MAETVLMERIDGEWHETQGSVKHRIANVLGFQKYEINLMETGCTNGITDTASFTVRGIGWFIDFNAETANMVHRLQVWDETDEAENDEQ